MRTGRGLLLCTAEQVAQSIEGPWIIPMKTEAVACPILAFPELGVTPAGANTPSMYSDDVVIQAALEEERSRHPRPRRVTS